MSGTGVWTLLDALRRRFGARARADAALRENEERFRSLTALSADWFWETDAQHRLSWLAGDQPLLRLFGRELAVGRRIWEITGVETEPQALKAQVNLMDAHSPFSEFEIIRRAADGAVQIHVISGEPRLACDGSWAGYRGVGRDVTGKRLAEQELAKAKERLELALEGGELGIWDLDITTGIRYLSDRWALMLGRPAKAYSLQNANVYELIHPDDRFAVNEAYRNAVKGIAPAYRTEYRLRTISGDWKWVQSSGSVTARNGNGRALRMSGAVLDIDRRKRAERLLGEAEERYRRLSEFSPSGILVVSNGIIEYANPAAARIFRADSPRQLVGGRFIDRVEPEHVNVAAARLHYLELGPGLTEFSDRRIRGLDGSSLIADGAAVSYLERGRILIQMVFRDVTEARKAHLALAEREQRFRDVVEASGEYVWEADAEFRYTYLSARIEAILGYPREQMLGCRPKDFMPFGEEHAVGDWFAQQAPKGQAFRDLVHRSLTRTGGIVWQSLSGVPVFDLGGVLKGYRGTGADITARRQAEERLQYLATRDAVTGLPNRALLADRARQALARAARRQSSKTLFLIDLHRFSAINDAYGHVSGDHLLRAIGERLSRMVREEDTLARLYGDDFALLWGGLQTAADMEKVALKILSSFTEPFAIGGELLRVDANIGIAVTPAHATDFPQLLRAADIALQHARAAGCGTYRLFSRETGAQVVPLSLAGRQG